MGVKVELLEDKAHMATQVAQRLAFQGAGGFTVNIDFAPAYRFKLVYQADQRRFTRAGRPADGKHLASANLKIDLL